MAKTEVTWTAAARENLVAIGDYIEDPTCRQIVTEGYRIIYELSGEKIYVLAVIAPGQDAKGILPLQKRTTPRHR